MVELIEMQFRMLTRRTQATFYAAGTCPEVSILKVTLKVAAHGYVACSPPLL